MVPGFVEKIQCSFLIDSGADISILNPEILERIIKDVSVEQVTTNERLRVLGGGVVNVKSKCCVTLRIGETETTQEFWVAEMTTDCLLGGDFLSKHGCIIDYQQMVFKINEAEVPLERFGSSSSPEALRVILEKRVKLKPYTEVVVQGKVVGGDQERGWRTVGPISSFCEGESGGIIVGRTLVDLKDGYVPVRIVNLSAGRKKLRKNTEIAVCEPCVSVAVQELNDPKVDEGLVKDVLLPERLQHVFEQSSINLDEDQSQVLKELLFNDQDLFSKGPSDLGCTNMVKHKIDVGDSAPIKQHPRRLPLAKTEEADQAIEEMLVNGIIEPSTSAWCSPIVLVRKKDGSTRFCVDYRKLNTITRKDAYPIPRLDTTLDSLSGSNWFSTLDLKSGYWQVELDDDAKEKTAFSSGKGLWQFKVMPFGLCTAPSTFQRLMEAVLSQMPLETSLVYIDDIIVHAVDFNTEVSNLKQVFKKLRSANLKLNPKKCTLFAREVIYLGHIVGQNGISADPKKVEAISTWPVPTTVKDVRRFLGLCSYYRRFIFNFAEMAKPLHRLTEKDVRFEWTSECQNAFSSLKAALKDAPVLKYPDTNKPYILDTDASKVGLGAVLSQEVEGREHVIAYYSRSLSRQESNYCTTRRELLAAVSAIEHFSPYLYGVDFLLRTDHSALQWLLQFKNPKDQMARWLEKLQPYNFTIAYRPGVKHGNADALSRRPCADVLCRHCEKREVEEGLYLVVDENGKKDIDHRYPDVQVLKTTVPDTEKEPDCSIDGKCWEVKELREAQFNDQSLRHIVTWLEEGEKPPWNQVSPFGPEVKAYWAQWDSLTMRNGVLYRKIEDSREQAQLQFVVPKSIRPQILKQLHDVPTAGHLGVTKTLSKLKEEFHWINCRRDVEDWCRRCEECAKRKGPQRKGKAPMKQYISGAPMERIAIDVLGPLPQSESGNKYVLVIADYFSKWTEAFPIPNQESKTIADVVVREFVCRYGVPGEIHSDQGRNFEAHLFSDMCQLLGINKTRTTPYRPQSDGMVERFNRTLENLLAKYVQANQKDWDRYIPFVMMAYRSATHESTGYSPSKLMFGRELRLPVRIMFGNPTTDADDVTQKSFGDYVTSLEEQLEEAHEFARLNLRICSDTMKTRYNIGARSNTYQRGDTVRYHRPNRKRGISPKLTSNWDGPYIVTRKINDIIYEIQRSQRAKPCIVHMDRLCKFHGERPEWFVTITEEPPSTDSSLAQTQTADNTTSPAELFSADSNLTQIQSANNTSNQETESDRTRPKRILKKPNRFNDFVMDF